MDMVRRDDPWGQVVLQELLNDGLPGLQVLGAGIVWQPDIPDGSTERVDVVDVLEDGNTGPGEDVDYVDTTGEWW